MSQEFFNVLQRHSEAKLTVLHKYVIPWMRKIVLDSRNPDRKCLVIDGFAGQGTYDGRAGGDLEEGVSSEIKGSPLILLEAAVGFCDQAKSNGWVAPQIGLIFIEGLEENFVKLKANLKEACGIEITEHERFLEVPNYPSIKIMCVNGQFRDVIEKIIVPRQGNLIPSFSFIDPFGFSHTPMDIIEKIMKNKKAEFLINFIYEETNRFIKFENEKIQEHISKHFGVADLDEIKQLIGSASGSKRKEIVIDYYTRQLKNVAKVGHALNFVINKKGRTKMILFFGTKSTEGVKLMKRVMWDVDGSGSYQYDDRKSLEEIQFSFLKELNHSEAVQTLATQIYGKFSGTKRVTSKDVENFVVLETVYPVENFMKPALVKLEDDEFLTDIIKQNGKKRIKHSFAEVFINFR